MLNNTRTRIHMGDL